MGQAASGYVGPGSCTVPCTPGFSYALSVPRSERRSVDAEHCGDDARPDHVQKHDQRGDPIDGLHAFIGTLTDSQYLNRDDRANPVPVHHDVNEYATREHTEQYELNVAPVVVAQTPECPAAGRRSARGRRSGASRVIQPTAASDRRMQASIQKLMTDMDSRRGLSFRSGRGRPGEVVV